MARHVSRSLCVGLALLFGCDDSRQSPEATNDAGAHEAAAPHDASEAEGATRPSAGCANASSSYAAGTRAQQLTYMGTERSFRLHVPPGYDGERALPLVMLFHGGGGSGRQFELASARMNPIADREGFVAVYPDGSGVLKTWNGVGCCGYAVQNEVDDVGFVDALLDHLETELCLDTRRLYASGMSNGAILSHRLACELSSRLAAVAPVAGTDMTARCHPSRPVPIMQIHGSDDGHVPWNGGEGCGPAGVSFTSVPDSLARWRTRNGCSDRESEYLRLGDGACARLEGCAAGADVVLCTIRGGGHNWPGGEPPADLVPCAADGFQSSSFSASEVIWRFFTKHALP